MRTVMPAVLFVRHLRKCAHSTGGTIFSRTGSKEHSMPVYFPFATSQGSHLFSKVSVLYIRQSIYTARSVHPFHWASLRHSSSNSVFISSASSAVPASNSYTAETPSQWKNTEALLLRPSSLIEVASLENVFWETKLGRNISNVLVSVFFQTWVHPAVSGCEVRSSWPGRGIPFAILPPLWTRYGAACCRKGRGVGRSSENEHKIKKKQFLGKNATNIKFSYQINRQRPPSHR